MRGDKRPFDLISIGECLVEFNRRDDGSFDAAAAGDAFNVLFYAARLGLRTGFISSVGGDLFTPMILSAVEGEGIDSSHLLQMPGERNGLYFIELDRVGEYTFHFWRQNSAATETLRYHDLDDLAAYILRSDYFLLTGVGMAVIKEPEKLLELLGMVKGGTQIVFDTNYRSRLWRSPEDYRRCFEEILGEVDILLPTASDLRAIYPGMDGESLLRWLAGRGPSIIAMKDGERGCQALYDGTLEKFPPRAEVSVVDTTGAGDAFNAGFIAGMVRGLPIGECCDLGQEVAVAALQAHGAINRDFQGKKG